MVLKGKYGVVREVLGDYKCSFCSTTFYQVTTTFHTEHFIECLDRMVAVQEWSDEASTSQPTSKTTYKRKNQAITYHHVAEPPVDLPAQDTFEANAQSADVVAGKEMDLEKLKKMFGGSSRIGGKGTTRRKKTPPQKTKSTPTTIPGEKNLQATLKRAGVIDIPNIQEVEIFQDDTVIRIINPKVQGSVHAKVWVFSGSPQTKGPDNSEEELIAGVKL